MAFLPLKIAEILGECVGAPRTAVPFQVVTTALHLALLAAGVSLQGRIDHYLLSKPLLSGMRLLLCANVR
jgi:hypothetical protein